jgi:HSP20 family molecular chaperone IbpA
VNRLFDDVFRGFGFGLPSFGNRTSLGGGWPSVEISDTEKEIKVTAEVPGPEAVAVNRLPAASVAELRQAISDRAAMAP